MEVYSPKKFQPASFSRNTITDKGKNQEPVKEAVRNEPRGVRPEMEERETLPERMRRVFYERLRAFFEYEEVS